MKSFQVDIEEPSDSDIPLVWACGCPMRMVRELTTNDWITVGGMDFPIICPEHGAPFKPEVLNAMEPILRSVILGMYDTRGIKLEGGMNDGIKIR